MRKNAFKLISFMLCFGFIFSFNFVFADSVSEETIIKNIANTVLDIIMWFAYAIAIGALIFFGIKYMLSGANEKADLKGMLPKYLIGLVAIIFCFTIAQFVADIAGNDKAEEIINVGEEAGEQFEGSSIKSDGYYIDPSECTEHEFEGKKIGTHKDSLGRDLEDWRYTCVKCGYSKDEVRH